MNKLIAVPVDEAGVLDAHFGHCKFFILITVENGEIINKDKVVPPPHEPGLLPKWLSEKGVTDILAGGMGQRAKDLFVQNRVSVFVGAPKLEAEKVVQSFLKNEIEFHGNYCDH